MLIQFEGQSSLLPPRERCGLIVITAPASRPRGVWHWYPSPPNRRHALRLILWASNDGSGSNLPVPREAREGQESLRVFGRLPGAGARGYTEAGVRKASKEESAGSFAPAVVSVYGDLTRGCEVLARFRMGTPGA